MNTESILEGGTPEVIAVVTDIDNTLGVATDETETLSAYTQRALADWLRTRDNHGTIETLREALAAESIPTDMESLVDTAYAWIRDQRQSPALEAVLGAFWRDAYAVEALDNTLSTDAVAQLEFWAEDRRALFIYAERPRVAQQALIAHTDHGDLAPLFAGFFDTRMGPSTDPATYNTIAAALGEIPASLLFVSADGERLDAAKSAGWQTCFLVRDDDTADHAHENGQHAVVDSFAAIELV
ncbi:hypothetical protein HKX42_09235 [Salinisphaera sp. USBA-960]|nr:hypothetical protein [Salifodinibacter halophilus]NNC27057.1 hypothetical protein [Salifodinibacter halophilus]